MSTHDAIWENPQAIAIPKEGYFERVEGNYGPIFPRTPANLRLHDHREAKAGARGCDAYVCRYDREGDESRPRLPRCL